MIRVTYITPMGLASINSNRKSEKVLRQMDRSLNENGEMFNLLRVN